MKTVLVITPDNPTVQMFEAEGWDVWAGESGPHDPHLLCFTGGADVSPYLYGEENISSHCDPVRDEYEKQVYESFVGKVPMVGICRGGQFLNVMNGGTLHQHLGRTISGDIKMEVNPGISEPMETAIVRVDHHQGIIPAEGATCGGNGWIWAGIRLDAVEMVADYIVWYPKTRCLCFQPHPEWGHEPTRELFFKLIEEYIG